MQRAILAASSLVFGCATAFGQTFEVASVKLSTGAPIGAPNSDGGPGTRYPERYATNITLRGLVFVAYGLSDYQEQIAGPSWIDTEKYAIDAKVPSGATKEQFQKMLQNLLADRFKLVIHHEAKVLPVFDMVVAKSGSKLKESVDAPAATPAAPPVGSDRDGFPVMPPELPGLAAMYSQGPNGPQSRWRAQQQPIAALAKMLGVPTNAGRIVIDKTGLRAKYDFTLYYDVQLPGVPAAVAVPDTPTLSLFDALEQQLGLKLLDGKANFDKIVIDRAERVPTEN